MSDNDQSLYNLRYNQVAGELEGFGGGTPAWTPLIMSSGDGANTALSNLASVAINTGLTPGLTNSIDLGSTGKQWVNTWTGAIRNSNGNLIDMANSLVNATDGNLAFSWFDGGINLRGIEFQDSLKTHHMIIQGPATISSNYTLSWPSAQGGASTFLQNDGTGVLSWVAGATGTPAGSSTQVQFNTGGSFAADDNFKWNADNAGVIGLNVLTIGGGSGTTEPTLLFRSPNAMAVIFAKQTGTANGDLNAAMVEHPSVAPSTPGAMNFYVRDGGYFLFDWTGDSSIVSGNAGQCKLRVADSANEATPFPVLIIDRTKAVLISDSEAGEPGISATTFNASAELEVKSTTKGLLQPRLTTTQRNAISSPAEGLSVYNSTTHQPEFYNGSAWTGGSGSGTVNNGTAGRLSLYASTTNAVADTYVQNAHNINVAIASQGSRSADLVITLPNPGNAVTAANVVLSEGAQTVNGAKVITSLSTGVNNLAFSSTLTPDVLSGNVISITLTGNLTLNGPTNGTDGQEVIFRLTQDGVGSHTLTLNTGAGNFVLGTTFSSVTLSTAAYTTDYVYARYYSGSGLWDVTNVVKGFTHTPAGFLHNRSLTIDHTKVGTVNNTDQTNFPVLVSISDATFKTVGNGGHVQNSNGYDIVFAADSGNVTPLFWEMESYDAVNGIIVAWVMLPTVSHTSDTVFYMFYDNAAISTFQSTSTSVWDTNFKGVYHLHSLTAESTIAGITATNSGATTTTGEIDGGAALASASTQFITAGSSSDFNLTTAGTTEGWFFITSGSTGRLGIIGKDNVNTDRNGYALWVNSALNKMTFELASGSAGQQAVQNTALSTQNTWHHVALTWDSSTVKIYLDGAQDYSAAQTVIPVSNVNPCLIGSNNGTGDYFNGKLDEMRLSNVARSADWIKTGYNNQNSPSTFITVGAEM